MSTNNLNNAYMDLVKVIHNFLSQWPTDHTVKKDLFPLLKLLRGLAVPTTFDQHNQVINLVEEYINTFVCVGGYHFKTALEDSEYSRLRFALHRENENACLRDQGYDEQPSLLRAGESTNPTLDYGAAYLELLELNKLVVAAYLEEMDYAEF